MSRKRARSRQASDGGVASAAEAGLALSARAARAARRASGEPAPVPASSADPAQPHARKRARRKLSAAQTASLNMLAHMPSMTGAYRRCGLRPAHMQLGLRACAQTRLGLEG